MITAQGRNCKESLFSVGFYTITCLYVLHAHNYTHECTRNQRHSTHTNKCMSASEYTHTHTQIHTLSHINTEKARSSNPSRILEHSLNLACKLGFATIPSQLECYNNNMRIQSFSQCPAHSMTLTTYAHNFPEICSLILVILPRTAQDMDTMHTIDIQLYCLGYKHIVMVF